MDNKGTRISNAFQIGLLGGLGVLTALALGNALVTLANIFTYVALALFIALGLEPIVSFIESKFKFKRGLAILTVVGTLLIVLGTLIWSILPMVISGSATRRSSLAFGKVVRISSCLNREAAMLTNIASRWALVRLNLRPDFW